MEQYRQQVMYEKKDLDGKLERLSQLIAGNLFLELTEKDQNLLTWQAAVMSEYSNILEQRIAAFTDQ